MTPEQKQQRIAEIEERQQWRSNAQRQNGRTPESNQEYADIADLLSLVKSQEAERNALSLALKNELTATARPAHRDYECMTTIADETLWCATCAARAEYLRGRSDAATSMRSACVTVAKDFYRMDRDDFYRKYKAAMLIEALESVSIQEQEAKQS